MATTDIPQWIKYLNIKNFKGIFSRDTIQNCTRKGFYIINLDDLQGPGNHWTSFNVKPHIIEYFDSFGLRPPEELKMFANKLGVNYVYNSSHYQIMLSVLCGYYCIYWIKEINKGKTYYEAINVFKFLNTYLNELFIINYFM